MLYLERSAMHYRDVGGPRLPIMQNIPEVARHKPRNALGLRRRGFGLARVRD